MDAMRSVAAANFLAPASAESEARRTLAEWAPLLGLRPDLSGISLKYERRGLSRRVVVFAQTIDGIPVEGGEVGVTISATGPILLFSGYRPDASRDASGSVIAPRSPALSMDAAVERVRESLVARAADIGTSEVSGPANRFGEPTVSEIWYAASDGRLRRGWRVVQPATEPLGEWLAIVDAASGEVIRIEDDARYAHPRADAAARADASTRVDATGKVFSPNPVVTLQDSTLVGSDMDDADQPVFDAAYKTVVLRDVTFAGGDYTLSGPYVRVVELRLPQSPPPSSSSPQFFFTRGDSNFEAVMVFYHIDRAQRYLQELGYRGASGIADFPIQADPHGCVEDQSFYTPGSKSLFYGDGCVDDAEDADVICHEYGHAIQDDQVPGWGSNTSARSIGEGFGDYWANSISEIAGYEDSAQVFDWDKCPPNWLARRVDSDLTMADYGGAIYTNALIWSAALWDLRSVVSGGVSDRLVLESHFGLPASASFEQNARSIAVADADMFGGAHFDAIFAAFAARGIAVDSTGLERDTLDPVVSIGVLQNPVLSAYLDVVVVASEGLDADALVGSVNDAALAFTQQDDEGRLFRGEYRIDSPGILAIQVTAADFGGNETSVARGFSAAKSGGGAPVAVSSPDGRFTIELADAAAVDGTWLLVGRAGPDDASNAAPSDAYVVGPVGLALARPAEVTLRPAPGRSGFERARLVRVESAEALETWLDPASGALVARLGVLGTIAVRESDAPPIAIDRAYLRLGPAIPNPTLGSTRIAFEVRAAQRVDLAVYSIAGERVRALVSGPVSIGEVAAEWDGRDDRGRKVGSGVYVFRLAGERASATRKVALVR